MKEEQLAHFGTFKWDENKRPSNVAKHGIDSVDAKEVFDDPAAYTPLTRRAMSERRYLTVGLMKGALVAVIFTHRNDAVRIISARVARRSERQLYGAKANKQNP